ncbi:hypothetical protein L5515_015812 [Caenorhabditis briggsae]|uniref:Uncharacterized protein n=1 Tax=Caenorhabditis briggsae TaxID=6238 RepID=A0AAE9EH47_CAEBR|nr:hypothetical protein L5515_015812 [Caenorhabditis briggsae]
MRQEMEETAKKLADAAQRNLNEISKAMAANEATKAKKEAELQQWKVQLQEKSAKMRTDLEKQGMEVMAKRKKETEEELQKLDGIKGELENQRGNIQKILQDGLNRRATLQDSHNEITSQMIKNHQDYILKSNETLNTFINSKNAELKALSEKSRADQTELTNRAIAMANAITVGRAAILDSMNADRSNDTMRIHCRSVQNYYGIFEDAFRIQSSTLTRMIVDMMLKRPLSTFPQTEIVTNKFENLRNVLTRFKGEERYKDLTEIQKQIEKGCDSVNEQLITLEGYFKGYEQIVKEEPKDKDALAEFHKLAKEGVDDLKKIIKEMGNLIKKFDIPITRAVDDQINQQILANSANAQLQISGKPSSEHQMLTE